MWLVSVVLTIVGFAAAAVILAAGILHTIAEYHARGGTGRGNKPRTFSQLTAQLKEIYRRLLSKR